MTDPIECPECEGRKGEKLGRLFLACRFCHGRGWVGGEHEPAEPPPPPTAPPPAWEHRIWTDPVVSAALGCRYCLGTGKVVSFGEGETSIIPGDCPACTKPAENESH